ncbi:uncharacterized protein [Panulirus ornatus]|uniref:uncharacterized protein n=1 Tax=Panulirus ornatus TaxID=150431 RepID=UPI003A882D6C
MAPARVMERVLSVILALMALSFFRLSHGRSLCERGKPDCLDAECRELAKCHHGFCDPEGNCECLPCFSGPTCSNYDNIYGPRFAIREDTVIIEADHQGVVYKATAEDEDLGLTCTLGPGLNTRCPCATIHYSILDQYDTKVHHFFDIHDSSGQIFLKPEVILEPGRHYQVHILASNSNDTRRNPSHPMMDVQILTVLVHSGDGLQELL